MFDHSLVDKTISIIAERFSPMNIIIFGLVARNEATDRSDLDILVIMDTDLPEHERAVPIYVAIRNQDPQDIIVMTPDEFTHSLKNPNSFTSKIADTGIIAYEAKDRIRPDRPLSPTLHACAQLLL